MSETVFTYASPGLKFGSGARHELAHELVAHVRAVEAALGPGGAGGRAERDGAVAAQDPAGADAAQSFAAPVPESIPQIYALLIIAGAGTAVLVDFLACGLRRVPLAGLPLLAVYTAPVSILDDGVSWWGFALGAISVDAWDRTMLRANAVLPRRARLRNPGDKIRKAAAALTLGPGADDRDLGLAGRHGQLPPTIIKASSATAKPIGTKREFISAAAPIASIPCRSSRPAGSACCSRSTWPPMTSSRSQVLKRSASLGLSPTEMSPT